MNKILESNNLIIEELIKSSGLPIDYNSYYFRYNGSILDEVGNKYIYKDKTEVIIIKIDQENVSLLHVKNDKLLYLYSRVDGSELKVMRGFDNSFSYVCLSHDNMRVILSNSYTFEVRDLLKEYQIKSNIKIPKTLEYTEFSFNLPILVEEESKELDIYKYIPESKLTVIKGNDGVAYETFGSHGRKYYREETFKVAPSLINSDILPRFKSSSRIQKQYLVVNPYIIEDISKSIYPLRSSITKELYKETFLEENSDLYRFYVRRFDEIVYAVDYFQNENSDNFYVFEEDLKKLQQRKN
ncbi:MAG: hypothetical protein J5982_02865 [Bacilli bacterium]|nr:hypothetical protein [Bacilli bacterium]